MPVTSKQRELGRHWVTSYLIGVSTLDAHIYLQIGDQSLAKLFGYIIIDLSTWKWLLACRDCFLSLSLHSFPNIKVHKTMIVYLSVSFWEMCLLWILNILVYITVWKFYLLHVRNTIKTNFPLPNKSWVRVRNYKKLSYHLRYGRKFQTSLILENKDLLVSNFLLLYYYYINLSL